MHKEDIPLKRSILHLESLVTPRQAVEAIEAAVLSGIRVSHDPPRQVVQVAHGQLLLMPSEDGSYAGVKVATVAPANPQSGLPRIQGQYLLFDAQTLTLVATMDGVALTNLRTSAVSIAAIKPFLRSKTQQLRVVCFGYGPQGRAHIDALTETVDTTPETTWVARDSSRARASLGPDASLVTAGSMHANQVVAEADIVFCATSAHQPLFDGDLPSDDAVVVAVGSHEPHVREIDARLMRRAHVVVEDTATALREAGDVIMAIDDGEISASDLIEMSDVITGRVQLEPNRPTVFKSSGMAWQDLVVAAAAVDSGSRD
ncbi:ornithine cyclodeaminase family protein [Rhodococcoides kyotonense]|uniref:Ornithine cyclodeaminase n=1 Tax=Rhodococcoides kyotonense TaxID=398843 RepID=A0A239N0Y5_9NOCA|nr:ornithine cyclodeaminase family protein [Rhodococcus kyotonensis]SNT48133.1 ornithine cyclodeaminase [Rhodococcus kyotonensis]